MFAALGDIRFDLPAYVTGTGMQRRQAFARHDRIQGKPVLQAIGTDLEQISIDIVFHIEFTDPELEIVRLRAAADRQDPLPLIYGNGTYKGRYVIESIDETVRNTDGQGNLIKLTARLALLEWHQPPGSDPVVDPARNEGRASGANSASRTLPPPDGPAPGAEPSSVTPRQIARRT
jgi:phage protein U